MDPKKWACPLILLSLSALFSCKTSEQIRREKAQDTLMVQMEHVRQKSTQQSGQLEEAQKRLAELYGQLEEAQHQEKKRVQLQEKEVNARLESLETKLVALKEQNLKQAEFIQEVTQKLKQLVRSPAKKAPKNAQKGNYQKAMKLFEQKKYSQARELFLQILGGKKISGSQWAYSHHALGIINFQQKKYQQAMVHLSKVYTRYPRSSKSPDALLHIAKSFIAMKQGQEAKQSAEQLLTQYPKSKEVKAAKKLLQGL